MNFILFDDHSWENLLPLTYTRPTAELRIGILKIREKWERYLNSSISFKTQDYLSKKYCETITEDNLLINGSVIPTNNLIEKILQLEINQKLTTGNDLIAIRLSKKDTENFNYKNINLKTRSETHPDFLKINYPWELFKNNGIEIENDFKLITHNRKSEKLSDTNNIINEKNIFIEKGASLEFVTLNAKNGPIYIGKEAEIMEGAVIRGPFAICENSAVKLSAKIYGPTTIGPYSKVGGEINNSIILGYSNKAHDGFIGNSVIGEWCNLGADTNNSNLKNNYAEVRIWNYPKQKFIKTGLQFCGLIMGDHSKCAINTMFNTGTVVGVNANIFGAGFPRNFIPSFSWGGSHGYKDYALKKAFEVAKKVMERRNIQLDEVEKKILTHIYNETEKFRKHI